ncbi:MAG: chloride channel protein [Alphaproteobacteria bacterium]
MQEGSKPGVHLRRVVNRLRRVFLNDQLVLFVLAIIVGAISGYGAIAFRLLIDLIQSLSLGATPGHISEAAAGLPAWHLVLVLTLGGLLIGLFVHFLMPGRRCHGVADVIEASALRGGRMSFRAGIGAALASAASIGVGASVGREGPVVHLGAALSSSMARRLHLSRSLTLTLLGCGVASAIAASFNAPIAGVIFALEVVVGHYALSSFAPIVIASVIGTMISRIHYGDFPAFIVPERAIVSFLELPAFALLGIVSAAVAIAFIYAVLMINDRMEKLPIPGWCRPMIGGLLMGLIALYFPRCWASATASPMTPSRSFSAWRCCWRCCWRF